jgi:hypothetical protein
VLGFNIGRKTVWCCCKALQESENAWLCTSKARKGVKVRRN